MSEKKCVTVATFWCLNVIHKKITVVYLFLLKDQFLIYFDSICFIKFYKHGQRFQSSSYSY